MIGGTALFSQSPAAQSKPTPAIEGYITAVHPHTGFDVNGTPVTTSPATTYQLIGSKGVKPTDAPKSSLRLGAYVEVMGADGGNQVSADSVVFLKDMDKSIEGFGVVERVIATDPELIVQSDGYRIRIGAGAATKFSGGLKTLADVGPDTWIKYEGTRDKAGLLVAAQAAFVPSRLRHARPVPRAVSVPGKDSLIDADGNFLSLRTKVRMSDAGGNCGWHRFPADSMLQARVSRVGQSVIPAYQKQLGTDSPSKIYFRFYAVDETRIRSELACNPGLILAPRQVVERLTSDDQLAALLADGVAYNLQLQSGRIAAEFLEIAGAHLAADLALASIPGAFLAADLGSGIAEHELEVKMEEQRGRIALELMSDAGYDPWQAPEAWRLLAPRNLPKDVATIRYPSRSGYQLGILNLQYSADRVSAASTSQPQASLATR
jgi:hypothetical protein